jgi:hypothetical protein
MLVTPHDICPHGNGRMHCMADCPLCDLEPEADFANRCEVAAEGDGREVVRRSDCLLDAWARWSEAIEEVAS